MHRRLAVGDGLAAAVASGGGSGALVATNQYVTAFCQPNIITGPTTAFNNAANACNSLAGSSTMANLDPPVGSYFPGNNLFPSYTAASGTFLGTTYGAYYNASSSTTMVGLPLAPQVGWGGGPNVTLGPPSGMYVYGVHTTPATTVTTAAGTSAVLLTYQVGTYQANSTGAPTLASLGTLVNTVSPGAFTPTGVAVTQTVTLTTPTGTTVGSPTCLQYLRTYPTYGTANDVNGVTGPAGSASPNCMAQNVTASGAALAQTTTVAAAVTTGYYGQATNFPGANGACYLNASSAACAACASSANANSGCELTAD
jgi:hypothetical protein